MRLADGRLAKDINHQTLINFRFHLKLPSGQGRIRTSVARKERQIYSLLPLTARPPVRAFSNEHRSWRRELNPRPADYKSAALPTELRQRRQIYDCSIGICLFNGADTKIGQKI